MSILWTYGAGIATILLAFFSLVEDFYIQKNSKRRIGMSLGLIIATVVTMLSIRAADKQHTEDEGKITNLQQQISGLSQLVKNANNTEKQNTKQLSDARATDTKQFLGEFDKLSARVASLQTQVATTDLKAEAEKLQADLESTRKAMQPEKARLTFSFVENAENPVHTLSTKQSGDVVHIKLWVRNSTDADALDGDVVILVCDACKFKSEPAGGGHVPGAVEQQRNITFQRVLAHSQMPTIEFDVETKVSPFQMAVFAVCRTCEPWKKSTPYSPDSQARVTITNPQAQPTGTYPSLTVLPYFKK